MAAAEAVLLRQLPPGRDPGAARGDAAARARVALRRVVRVLGRAAPSTAELEITTRVPCGDYFERPRPGAAGARDAGRPGRRLVRRARWRSSRRPGRRRTTIWLGRWLTPSYPKMTCSQAYRRRFAFDGAGQRVHEPAQVEPGVLGFLIVAGLGVVLYFLLRSMNKQLRKVSADRQYFSERAGASQRADVSGRRTFPNGPAPARPPGAPRWRPRLDHQQPAPAVAGRARSWARSGSAHGRAQDCTAVLPRLTGHAPQPCVARSAAGLPSLMPGIVAGSRAHAGIHGMWAYEQPVCGPRIPRCPAAPPRQGRRPVRPGRIRSPRTCRGSRLRSPSCPARPATWPARRSTTS